MIAEERREVGVDRVPVRRPVAICVGRQGTVLRGETVDLSPRGMQVAVNGDLQVGEHLVFRLDLGPEFSPVIEGGEVAWVSPSGSVTTAGVRFVSLPRRPPGRLDPLPLPEVPRFSPGEELRVKVDGMAQPLRAEFIDQEGLNFLRFRCPLPFLRLRSPVVVHSGAGTEAVFEGVVGAVEVVTTAGDGIPELVVTVCSGIGEGEIGGVGALESAGVPVSSARPASTMSAHDADAPGHRPLAGHKRCPPPPDCRWPSSFDEERPTVPDARFQTEAGSAEALAQEADGVAPVDQPGPQSPLASALDKSTRASCMVIPSREGTGPKQGPKAPPAEPVQFAQRASALVWGIGQRSAAAVARSVRRAAALLWPLLRSLVGLLLAGVAWAGREVKAVVAETRRRWRRSRLPQTYSDVVGRQAQRSSSARGSRLVHRLAVAMGLLGVGLAVWGLVTASVGGDEHAPASPAGGGPSESLEVPIPDVPSAWPSAGELLPADHETPTETLASSPAPAVNIPAPAANIPGPAVVEEPPAATRPAPSGGGGSTRQASRAAPGERNKRFVIELDGPPQRISDYALRQPPGIVVDVTGAGPVNPGAAVETGSNRVRLVKVSPRADRTRFVIYLRGQTMPRYTIDPEGNGFAVTLLD